MSAIVDHTHRVLRDYATALGGAGPVLDENEHLCFDLSGCSARVRVKAGGSRIRGSVVLAQLLGHGAVDAARAWLERQPLPPTADLDLWEGPDGVPLMRMVWERSINPALADTDPIAGEVGAYLSAWRRGADVVLEPSVFDLADPRDTPPQQAWLVIGDGPSWPSQVDLDEQVTSGDAGIFEGVWTAAKQTQAGDLLLFYFTGERKSVHFVARAASAAFYSDDIAVVTEGHVADQQWWVFHTPLIAVKPISYTDLKAATHDQLILRGRSGKFLPPSVIGGLAFEAVDPADQVELDRVVQTPTGRADLPDPESMTWEDVRVLAGGALALEADVETYIVKPLLSACLEGTELEIRPQYAIGRQRADFVVVDGERPRCVIEVKLAINDSGSWAHSPDLRQTVGYAKKLDCAAVLIDTRRIVLVDRGAETPARIIERADLAKGFMWSGTLHDLAEHLGFPFRHRANQAGSYREPDLRFQARQRQDRSPRTRGAVADAHGRRTLRERRGARPEAGEQ